MPATPLALTGPLAELELAPIAVPRTGLQLPHNLPFETWARVGKQLSTVARSLTWCLGDWLVYGETTYRSRYRDAVEQTGLDYQTLRNYAWVAKRFAMPRRRDMLSFGHHVEVAALPEPEQDFWLRKAEEFGWTRNRMRAEVRASLRERSPGAESGRDMATALAGGQPEMLRIQAKVTAEQLELFGQAATRAGLSIEKWAIDTLEWAARQGSDGGALTREAC
jgi:hypothetical protein